MPKQFGSKKPSGFDPNRVKAPLAGSANLPDPGEGSLWAGGEEGGGKDPIRSAPGTEPFDTAAAEEISQMHGEATGMLQDTRKRKKFDWKGAVQAGLNSYRPEEEDPLTVLDRMRANESAYMNREMY